MLVTLETLPPRGALLGLDPGTKTIGVAVSDWGRLIATPVETIERRKFAWDASRIFKLYDARECVGIIIGMPVNMDGSTGPRAQSVRAFARNLEEERDIPVAYWDERMSTMAAQRTLLEADASRARRKQVIDAMAASFILQGALDRLNEPDIDDPDMGETDGEDHVGENPTSLTQSRTQDERDIE